MTKNPIYLAALLISFIPVSAFSGETINKSPDDPREYSTFTLKNGIEVVTVSDPQSASSAASLSVGVGAFQDPENAQGIAHFLEHMLFMGSKKYPSPNEYLQFIQQNGGSANAFTAGEQTTYLFSINSSQFSAALDRLSSSIKDPLFDSAMVGKEINAVNSEWLLSRQSDQFIQQRTAAITGNPMHPRNQLGVGNNQTLPNIEEDLLASLEEFYSSYYSANLMKLVLVGKQNTKELKKLAKKYFSNIKNSNINRPTTNLRAYREEDLGANIYVQSRVKSPELVIEFSIEDNSAFWRSKPNQYLEMLLNSQEPQTLMNVLTEQGYIQDGQASINPNAWGADGSAFISYTLTDQGLANKNFIISNTFHYIDLIKKSNAQQEHFKELAAINQIQFEDYQLPSALDLAVAMAFRIYDVPFQHLIDYSYITSDFNREAIEELLSQLDPARARIYHISPDEMIDQTLEFADGGYSFKSFETNIVETWQNEIAALKIPQPQVIDLDAEILEFASSSDYQTPTRILEDEGVQAFLSHTQNFQGREAVLVINLGSSMPSKNAENLTYAFILNAVFRKKHRLIYQRAFQKNGVRIFSDLDDEGNTTFALLGRSSTQIKYAKDLLIKFSNFNITERDFNDAIKSLKDSYDSISEQGLSSQLSYYASTATKQGPFFFSKKQIFASLDQATLQDFNLYYQAYLNSLYVDIFSHGTQSPDKIIDFATYTRALFGETSQSAPWEMADTFQVVPGTGKVTKVSTPKDGIAMTDIYIYPEKSLEVQAQFAMINKLFSQSFFNDLRTSQQLGYAVFSLDYDIHDYPAIGMTIVSDKSNLQDLKEKMMTFQYGFDAALKNIYQKIIGNIKKSLLEDLDQTPENIIVEAFLYIDDWGRGNYEFDTQQKIRNAIAQTTKSDLVNLNHDFVRNAQYMNVTIQIKGKNFTNTPYFSWDAVE